MSALANSSDCLECHRLSSTIAQIQRQIIMAKSELQEAVEAADGTSARKYDELQALIKNQEKIFAEMRTHDSEIHAGYVTESTLTQDIVET
jgi:ABC-type transporter Mla subunit MlaD